MKENRYKKAMDDVCDRNFNISAEDMLAKAKASAGTERNIVMKRSTKRNIIGRIAGTAAACLVISGTVASAMGYVSFKDKFRELFGKDETTAELIDEGYYTEIGQERSNDDFTVAIDTVTGDRSRPKLLFNVTVKNEELAEEAESVRLCAYILNEETYADRLDDFGMWEASGDKDPDEDNLFRVCMEGPAAFIVNEQDLVVAVKKVSFETGEGNEPIDYDENMEFRFKVPEEALKESRQEFYEGIVLNSGKVDYALNYGDFGSYETLLTFSFDFIGNELAGGATDYSDVYEKFDDDWLGFSDGFILNVDGKEYSLKEHGYTFCCESLEGGKPGECSTSVVFPSVDYDSAEKITLTAGGETYTLK